MLKRGLLWQNHASAANYWDLGLRIYGFEAQTLGLIKSIKQTNLQKEILKVHAFPTGDIYQCQIPAEPLSIRHVPSQSGEAAGT